MVLVVFEIERIEPLKWIAKNFALAFHPQKSPKFKKQVEETSGEWNVSLSQLVKKEIARVVP